MMTEFQQEEIEAFKEYLKNAGPLQIRSVHIQLLCGYIFHFILILISLISNHIKSIF